MSEIVLSLIVLRTQLEASGFKYCLEEFSQRSDLCVVEACKNCRCITILCICSATVKEEFGVFKSLIPSSSVKAMLGVRVYTDARLRSHARDVNPGGAPTDLACS
jgi:hypothetical protein